MTSVSEKNLKAVVLLSGGLDSYTSAAIAKSQGFDIYALSVNYGQRDTYELTAAKQIAASLAVKDHKIISIDLRSFGGSALTADIDVPKSDIGADTSLEIPVTYVPARNTILLSMALGWAEVLGAFDIFIGANAVDFSGYPDCRAEFLNAFENLANLATKAGVEGPNKFKIHAPLLDMTKAQIVQKGYELNLDYSISHSCYDPAADGTSCGHCDSCLLRLKGFKDAGKIDPLKYI
ncbi:MAG: 7-cyano-7-deazaguanine synthase QueC [Phycisphaerae bacterium]|nr:7-cyano-7-deazaguanine synthase QueC [Phycisphaerae bacterium]